MPAFLLSLVDDAKKSRTCLLFGLSLGFGYYAKAILFPMALVFMAVAFLVIGRGRRATLPISITLFVFTTIAAPLLTLVSMKAGRPSFSESGRLNVAWQINGEKMLPFQPGPASHLIHPMNLLYRHPDVFAFGSQIATTYPLWQDPGYWNAGTDTSFSMRSNFSDPKKPDSFLCKPIYGADVGPDCRLHRTFLYEPECATAFSICR